MFWYVSRINEIFVDTDNYSRSIKHTASRLLGAIKCNRLDVLEIEQHPSSSADHIHTLITLKHSLSPIERYVWALILHSDIYRTASTIMRELNGVPAPDVFITPHRFNRAPDDVCNCDGKHKGEVMQNCPAAIRQRGDDRVRGFFGLPDHSAKSLEDVKAYLDLQL